MGLPELRRVQNEKNRRVSHFLGIFSYPRVRAGHGHLIG